MGISCLVGIDRSETGLTKRHKARADTALRLLQAGLLVTGLTLLVVYAAAQVDSVRGREQALEAFAQARSERVVALAHPALAASPSRASLEYSSEPDQSLWGEARIAAYRDSASIPARHPSACSRSQPSSSRCRSSKARRRSTLNRGVGRIEGTAEVDDRGNLGLAGHRDGFFRVLKDVEIGDAIEVQSLEGTTRYRITEL